MLAPQWTWWSSLLIALVAVVVMFAPGFAALSLVRVRRWTALAAAPLVTAGVVGVGGVALATVHVPWTPLTAFVVSAVVVAVAAVARRWVRPVEPEPWSRLDLHRAAGVLVSAAIGCTVYAYATGRPGDFMQNPDMIFHLDLTRWFTEHQTVSTFDTGLGTTGPQFYPAALHGIAATVGIISGAPAVISLTMTQLVFIGVAWPLGVLALLDALGLSRPVTVWIASFVAMGFPVMPFRLLGYGPLWPFDAGLVLLPVWLAFLVLAARAEQGSRRALPALIIAACTLPCIALLHTGVALTAFIPAYFIGLQWGFQKRHSFTGLGRVVPILLGLSLPLLVIGGVFLAPQAVLLSTNTEPLGVQFAARDALRLWAGGSGGPKLWPGGPDRQAAASGFEFCMLVLSVYVTVRRRMWWITPAVLVPALLAVFMHWFGSDWARWLTWPWYNVVERVRVVTGVFMVIAVVVAIDWLSTLGQRRTRRAMTAAALIVAAVLSWVAWTTDAVTLNNYANGRGFRPWLLAKEADSLRVMSDALPDDAVVVASPWNGANFIQALGPEHAFIPTEKSDNADISLIAARLDQAAHDPEVCRILTAHRASYLIVGGDPASTSVRTKLFASFDRAAHADGFEKVLEASPYTLYKITACG